MRKRLIFILCLSSMFIISGCTEEDYQKVDKVAETTVSITEAGEAFINSPAGLLIPPGVTTAIKLGGYLAVALAGAWAAWRENQKKKLAEETLSAVVKAVDSSPTNEGIKTAVSSNLKESGIKGDGDLLIDKAKNK